MADGDIRGALGGSRLLDQPEHRAKLDAWTAFLDGDGPVLLEIGFDHGRRLSGTAAAWPGWRVAGVEVRRRRVEEMQAWAARHGLTNLLAWRIDARTLLAVTPAERLDVIEALFPDPWWDEAHRARRLLVDRRFLDDAARTLRPGGVLHLATDVPDYAAHVDALLAAHPGLVDDPAAAERRPAIVQQSRREWKCAREQVPVRRWWVRRR